MFRQINVQISPGTAVARGKSVVSALPGVVRVREVFPDQEDDELRRMLVADVEDAQEGVVLSALHASEVVQEAELVPQRGVRPRLSSTDTSGTAKG